MAAPIDIFTNNKHSFKLYFPSANTTTFQFRVEGVTCRIVHYLDALLHLESCKINTFPPHHITVDVRSSHIETGSSS